MIRNATIDDIDPLSALEERSFSGDRISRRGFRYLLTRANAAALIESRRGVIRGYVLLLFRAGSRVARLYSIAVAPEARGQGVARTLLGAAEKKALASGCAIMRLEIREDNQPSIALFRGHGYHRIGEIERYYHDGTTALRFEKNLVSPERPDGH